MPIVLFTDPKPRSGHVYDDRTGVSYEFPDRYLRLVREGERFLYHRSGPPSYRGTGIVGRVAPSSKPSHSICEILDYQPFDQVVPVMSPEGHFFEAEPGSGKTGVYFAQGVRPISEGAFEQVLAIAGVDSAPNSDAGVGGFADAATALTVERHAVDAVLALLNDEYPEHPVVEMVRNNPGFDILVGDPQDAHAFIEVKGTQAAEPVFWLTEGERKFSIANADRYELFVIAGIDLGAPDAHRVHRRKGAVDGEGVTLEPSQWRGHLTTTET